MRLHRALGHLTAIASLFACSLPSAPTGLADDVGGTHTAGLLVLVGDSGATFGDPASLHLIARCPGTWVISGSSAKFRGHFAIAADSSPLCHPISGSLNASLAYSGYERDWTGFLTVEGSPDHRSKVDVFTGCVYQHSALQPSATYEFWTVSVSDETGSGRGEIIAGFDGIFVCATNLLRGRYEIHLIVSVG